MITTEFGYKQTLELIERLEKAIASDREKFKGNPEWLELMEEAPLDDLEKLKAEADEYLRLQRKAS